MHASSPHHRWPILVPTLQSIYSSSLMMIFCINNRKLEQVVFSLQSEQPNSPPIIGFPSETFRYVTAPRDWNSLAFILLIYRRLLILLQLRQFSAAATSALIRT
jgi:hypothetical protein